MKQRHRMPTIFSIYMVDVLCCALGCVILLWLINFRDAKQRSQAASETGKHLAETRATLDATLSELAGMRGEITAAQKREQDMLANIKDVQAARAAVANLLLLARKEQSDTKLALRLSDQQLAALRIELKDLQASSAASSAKLTLKTAELAQLLKKLASAERKSRELSSELASKTRQMKDVDAASVLLSTELAELKRLAKDYKSKLSVAEIRTRLVDDDLVKSKKEVADIRKLYQDMLLAQELLSKRLLSNTKQLKDAQAVILGLKDEKLTLAQQMRLVREMAERRFAGITLTGKNVLFLVDMSGSMDLTDENTPDPDKWPLVCETVARIMESLPDLSQYQVILFSDRVRYPLGSDGSWVRYNPETSAKSALRALKAVKPNGETNMAAVFDEAFRFRAEGLDTIYVLSDGLPNAGPGLPAASQNLSVTQKTEVLSKYVRNRLKYVLNRAAANQPRVRINTIGFFFESPEVGAFLWALAREHDGSFVGMSK
jgi:hypothetical protein